MKCLMEVHNYLDSVSLKSMLSTYEYLLIASFKSFDDYLNIYLNAYSFKWHLHIDSEYYNSIHEVLDLELDCVMPQLYSFNTFQELESKLCNIIEEDFDFEIQHNAKRWWSFLPEWIYLERIYIHRTFINYFQVALEGTLDSVDIEISLTREEQRYLKNWWQELNVTDLCLDL